MIRRAAVAAGLIFTLAAPLPARAYVRARAAQSPQPTFWDAGCQVVTIYLNGFTQMTPDEVAKSIAAAAHAWSPDAVTCPAAGNDGGTGAGHPSFEIITQMAADGRPPAVGPDGINAVIFRTDGWQYGDAIALTSRNTDPSGRIFDADIEVNAVMLDPIWANLDPNASGAPGGLLQMDLQTAITHEFGHFLGLAHTCYNEGVDPPPRPNDDQGVVTPLCKAGAATPEAAAVMWYQVDPGLTGKRVITSDDARGVCAIYPPNAVAPTCAPNLPLDGCGCVTAGRPSGLTAALAALAALLANRRRRR
jgi:MYXO-CTERM domain-containing protein